MLNYTVGHDTAVFRGGKVPQEFAEIGVFTMTKILFVCHGNICRSPMAEFILKDMVHKLGRADEFLIDSAATTAEELGNGVYPPVRTLLEAHGIDCGGKTARLLRRGDYEDYDLIIGMDDENMRDLHREYGRDRDGKLRLLLDFTARKGQDIYDPWYTRDFQRSWDDVWYGCLGLLSELLGDDAVLDFSACETRSELYAVLRREMLWQDFYGENLDALWDILTGLPHRGRSFTLIMPDKADSEAGIYAPRIRGVFEDALEEED